MDAFHDIPIPYREIRIMAHQEPLASNVGVDLHKHTPCEFSPTDAIKVLFGPEYPSVAEPIDAR